MIRNFYIIVAFYGLIGIAAISNNLKPLNYSNDKSCTFNDPDTSVSGIVLRDENSTIRILGKDTKLEGDSTHHFFSKDKDQILSMTVHPGDYRSQISIFKIGYAKVQKLQYRQTQIESFKTEKGICLGVSKANVIDKLGTCYTGKIIKDAEIINYRLESPQDSGTKLMARQNMPIYFAAYKFYKGKLVSIEFGFEYP